jgi:hypothetical protein
MNSKSPLITLFKEQLENESRALAAANNLQKRGDFLIWWYFTKWEWTFYGVGDRLPARQVSSHFPTKRPISQASHSGGRLKRAKVELSICPSVWP